MQIQDITRNLNRALGILFLFQATVKDRPFQREPGWQPDGHSGERMALKLRVPGIGMRLPDS
jgi:hypothetical protein